VISRKCDSVKGNADMDWGLYRYRHLVENAFARLKQYRVVATRYDKLKRNYESMVAMACGYLCATEWLRIPRNIADQVMLRTLREWIVPSFNRMHFIFGIGGIVLKHGK
jgi:hypothetical protein